MNEEIKALIEREAERLALLGHEEDIGKEICIIIHSGAKYFGILRDSDDEELTSSRPNAKISLGFQLSCVRNIFVKEE
ncbi:hypothetical protein G7051_16525 [Dysgonomonas sp. HDW5B]|uniref:hypothetical protein n=1 Tax=Dysgonomonas sp. HDW5B TaxID=2714927 RepID=UPI00140CC47B|nr:hypothetical protein [Dysgonomonas sp. HDW5B]QIK55866.1 hypothetical protein G7051_16525 [Dysgonomonas sp. HDW5B]